MDSGIRPKKCPTPMAGSSICAPLPRPRRCNPFQMASMTIGDVKCAFGVEARADSYSALGEQFLHRLPPCFSILPAGRIGIRWAWRPSPRKGRVSAFSSSLASRFSASRVFRRRMAAILSRAFSCSPPCPIRCARGYAEIAGGFLRWLDVDYASGENPPIDSSDAR